MTAQDDVTVILDSALDEALRVYIGNAFTGWLVDNTGQPERATAGARKAVTAYQNARKLRGDPATIEHVRAIMREALDRSFTAYIVKLFGVYLHEGAARPSTVVRNSRQHAIDAYVAVRTTIERMHPSVILFISTAMTAIVGLFLPCCPSTI